MKAKVIGLLTVGVLLSACGGPSDTNVEKAARSYIEGSGVPLSSTKNLGCTKAKDNETKLQGDAYLCRIESVRAGGQAKATDTLVVYKEGEIWYAQK